MWLRCAGNLRQYLSFSGVSPDDRARARLQVLLTAALGPAARAAGQPPPAPEALWAAALPAGAAAAAGAAAGGGADGGGPLARAARYRLARRALAAALQAWADAAQGYRLARRRVRALRHEAYTARRAVRTEWR